MDINPNGCVRQLEYLLFASMALALARLDSTPLESTRKAKRKKKQRKISKEIFSKQRFIAKQKELFELLIKFPLHTFKANI